MDPLSKFRSALAAIPGTYIIGVAGDSGSGKTTFTAALRHLFGDQLVSTITLDDYHTLNRQERKERNITPLAPEANNLDGLLRDLQSLKEGRSIDKMVYNHTSGRLEGPVEFTPSRILILEGLHPLFSPALRENIDFSLYVDPAPAVKKEWKIKRDTGKRGYSERDVLEEMRRRENDYHIYIEPQRDFADVVIHIAFSRFGRELGWLKDIYRISLFLTPVSGDVTSTAGFMVTLPPLITLEACQFSLEYAQTAMGKRMMAVLTLDGTFDRRFIASFSAAMGAETGIDPSVVFGDKTCFPPTDVVQLVICWRIMQDILART